MFNPELGSSTPYCPFQSLDDKLAHVVAAGDALMVAGAWPADRWQFGDV
jgi:hypothetical protein